MAPARHPSRTLAPFPSPSPLFPVPSIKPSCQWERNHPQPFFEAATFERGRDRRRNEACIQMGERVGGRLCVEIKSKRSAWLGSRQSKFSQIPRKSFLPRGRILCLHSSPGMKGWGEGSLRWDIPAFSCRLIRYTPMWSVARGGLENGRLLFWDACDFFFFFFL